MADPPTTPSSRRFNENAEYFQGKMQREIERQKQKIEEERAEQLRRWAEERDMQQQRGEQTSILPPHERMNTLMALRQQRQADEGEQAGDYEEHEDDLPTTAVEEGEHAEGVLGGEFQGEEVQGDEVQGDEVQGEEMKEEEEVHVRRSSRIPLRSSHNRQRSSSLPTIAESEVRVERNESVKRKMAEARIKFYEEHGRQKPSLSEHPAMRGTASVHVCDELCNHGLGISPRGEYNGGVYHGGEDDNDPTPKASELPLSRVRANTGIHTRTTGQTRLGPEENIEKKSPEQILGEHVASLLAHDHLVQKTFRPQTPEEPAPNPEETAPKPRKTGFLKKFKSLDALAHKARELTSKSAPAHETTTQGTAKDQNNTKSSSPWDTSEATYFATAYSTAPLPKRSSRIPFFSKGAVPHSVARLDSLHRTSSETPPPLPAKKPRSKRSLRGIFSIAHHEDDSVKDHLPSTNTQPAQFSASQSSSVNSANAIARDRPPSTNSKQVRSSASKSSSLDSASSRPKFAVINAKKGSFGSSTSQKTPPPIPAKTPPRVQRRGLRQSRPVQTPAPNSLLYSEGRLSPTKGGSYGIKRSLKTAESLRRAASQAAIVEEGDGEGEEEGKMGFFHSRDGQERRVVSDSSGSPMIRDGSSRTQRGAGAETVAEVRRAERWVAAEMQRQDAAMTALGERVTALEGQMRSVLALLNVALTGARGGAVGGAGGPWAGGSAGADPGAHSERQDGPAELP